MNRRGFTISFPKKSNPCNDLIACVLACTSRKTTCACPLIFLFFMATTSRTGPYVEKSIYSARRRSVLFNLSFKLVQYRLSKLKEIVRSRPRKRLTFDLVRPKCDFPSPVHHCASALTLPPYFSPEAAEYCELQLCLGKLEHRTVENMKRF